MFYQLNIRRRRNFKLPNKTILQAQTINDSTSDATRLLVLMPIAFLTVLGAIPSLPTPSTHIIGFLLPTNYTLCLIGKNLIRNRKWIPVLAGHSVKTPCVLEIG